MSKEDLLPVDVEVRVALLEQAVRWLVHLGAIAFTTRLAVSVLFGAPDALTTTLDVLLAVPFWVGFVQVRVLHR